MSFGDRGIERNENFDATWFLNIIFRGFGMLLGLLYIKISVSLLSLSYYAFHSNLHYTHAHMHEWTHEHKHPHVYIIKQTHQFARLLADIRPAAARRTRRLKAYQSAAP